MSTIANAVLSAASTSGKTKGSLENSNQAPASTFMRAAVVELLNDPSYYDDSTLIQMFSRISNKDILTGNPQVPPFSEANGDTAEKLRYLIPRNSVLVNILNAGASGSENGLTLCFPFFPPHIQLPVKPGEQIWVTTPDSTNPQYIYWMCRITGPGFVDDINYTHLDRQILPAPTAVSASFPNGPNTPGKLTLKVGSTFEEQKKAFSTIVTNSSSSLSFTPDPVPRLSRRPGDLVLQGSNNTLILMSDDRGWGSSEDPEGSGKSNASKTDTEQDKILAGSIDVVVGRGRFLKQPELDAIPAGTSPQVIENSRDGQETGKYFTNPIEGDPDFVSDSSRVYISMNTNGDEKLGLEYPSIDGTSIDPVNDSPYVIMKSDEI